MTNIQVQHIIHNQFQFNGASFSNVEAIVALSEAYITSKDDDKVQIGQFLLEWFNDKEYINAKTSGSTGRPKQIQLSKQAMVKSAKLTAEFFKLRAGDTALLCLPANYIAGKMMLVRALVLGLKLDSIVPKLNLDIPQGKLFAFCAMTPIQLSNSLNQLNLLRTIIVGGAPISEPLKNAIIPLQPLVFETYGMTETASHIAIKPLVHKTQSNVFKVLPGIAIEQDNRQCLVITAPHVSKAKIITNDIVEMTSTHEFIWLGRFDNVINTGGVKVFPEQIESKLESQIKNRFFIAATPDKDLGEAVTLVIENSNDIYDNALDVSNLSKFERPKHIVSLARFSETNTGKINRKDTLKQVLIN